MAYPSRQANVAVIATLLALAAGARGAPIGLRASQVVAANVLPASSVPRFVKVGDDAPKSLDVKNELISREGLGENLPYPGSDYLGLGYNLIYGNPAGDPNTQTDPGWRAPILQLQWSQDNAHLSRDMRFLTPIGGWAYPEYSCSLTQSSREMQSESDYSSSLSVDASVEGSGGLGPIKGSFSASAGYASFNREVAEKQSSRFQLRSYCLQFRVALDPVPQLAETADPIAKGHMEALPTGQAGTEADMESMKCTKVEQSDGPAVLHCFSPADMAKWAEFFDRFGTHVATEVHLGGKLVTEVTMTKETMQSLSDVDVSAALSASFGTKRNSVSASASMQTSSSASSKVENAQKDMRVSVFGGLPPKDNDVLSTEGFGEWAESVREAPMPVRYSLCGLDVCGGLDHTAYHAALAIYRDDVTLASEAARAMEPKAVKDTSVLRMGEQLVAGEELTSKRNGYVLKIINEQPSVEDKLHYRKILGLYNAGGSPIWFGKSFGTPMEDRRTPATLRLQGDCILVMYDRNNAPLWSSNTYDICGTPGSLKLQDSGNLALTDIAGKVVWQSDTANGKQNLS